MECKDHVGDDGGDQSSGEHRNVEEQVERDDRTEKLGQVGGHRAEFGDDPHGESDGF